MILTLLRALFVLLMAAIGWHFITTQPGVFGDQYTWLAMTVLLVAGVVIVCVDILAPRRKLTLLSGSFLGLIVGLLTTYAFSFIVAMLVDRYVGSMPANQRLLMTLEQRAQINTDINIVLGVIFCYIAISFILQSKDDFRFIIPYVEFSKQTKGARPMLLDTSVLIDGRIADIADTGVLDSRLVVPRFVLAELQLLADNGDKLKRNRGRRGLDMLTRLQGSKRVEVTLYDSSGRTRKDADDVDSMLMDLAAELNGRVLTNDFNLNKVASLRGVEVISLNELANAMKPVVLPGEKMAVRLVKAGESPGQGVGYLEDGTMVVVEQGRPRLNEEVEFVVTNMMQTAAGRMIFGRLQEPTNEPRQQPRPRPQAPSPPTDAKQSSH